ncbi:chromosomal replication initiator protein DnaA [Candidatus Microgenomates bacterium]|nr:chromosomal replication initiator protein DnaA [Candidatus Microgenomates bacterium]
MNEKKVWNTILSEIELQVSKPIFMTFFKKTQLSSLKNKTAKISCSNPMVINMIEKRYYSLLKNAVDKHLKKNVVLEFFVEKEKEKKEIGPLFSKRKIVPLSVSESFESIDLRPDFTFDSFAVSSLNQMAYAAATAVAQSPGTAYNPLFLYGGVGVGKTHLMQAVGHKFLAKKKGIIYCMGEEFTNEIIDAIRTKNTKAFKQKYRSTKALLVDDIQFIAGKNAVQEEFFHTFNAVLRAGGQIILTSDRPPQEISKLEERLRSRFEGGLIIDVPPPNFELRCAILLIKAGQRGVDLPMNIVQLIAGNITSVRALEGILTRLSAEAKTKNKPITLEVAEKILGKTSEKEEAKKRVLPKNVLKEVASHFNLKISLLKGKRRDKNIVLPRQVLMYLLRTENELPLMEIGRILGGRDHTTILHGVKKITGLLSKEEFLREDVLGIKKRLWGKI